MILRRKVSPSMRGISTSRVMTSGTSCADLLGGDEGVARGADDRDLGVGREHLGQGLADDRRVVDDRGPRIGSRHALTSSVAVDRRAEARRPGAPSRGRSRCGRGRGSPPGASVLDQPRQELALELPVEVDEHVAAEDARPARRGPGTRACGSSAARSATFSRSSGAIRTSSRSRSRLRRRYLRRQRQRHRARPAPRGRRRGRPSPGHARRGRSRDPVAAARPCAANSSKHMASV